MTACKFCNRACVLPCATLADAREWGCAGVPAPSPGPMPDAPPSRGQPGHDVPTPAASVPELLESAAATYRQRNAQYGDNYKHFGPAAAALFPQGLTLRTADDWNRLGLFVHAFAKFSRYAANFSRGGHQDSAHDLSVYAAMLEELTSKAAP